MTAQQEAVTVLKKEQTHTPAAVSPAAAPKATPVARRAGIAGLALALAATVVWSGNFVIARVLHDTVPPVQTAFWRWVIALLAVAPVALPQARRQWPVIRRHLGFLTMSALLGITVFNTLVYQAGVSTSATNMSVIAAAAPVLIVLFSRLSPGGERLGARRVAGMTIATAGVLTLIGKGSPAALLALDFAPGDLWMLAATASFAGYSALLRRKPKDLGQLAFLFATFVLGAALLAPAYAISLVVQGGFAPSVGTVGPLLYVGVFSSALAYFAWNKAIALVGAARAGVLYYLQPVCVAVLSFLVLGEQVGVIQAVCVSLIVAGVALGSGGRR